MGRTSEIEYRVRVFKDIRLGLPHAITRSLYRVLMSSDVRLCSSRALTLSLVLPPHALALCR